MDWISEWIGNLERDGELCGDYALRARDARSVRALWKLLSDANGLSYLCELWSRGYNLPLGRFVEYFRSYVNGGELSVHENGKGGRYVTATYCLLRGSDCVVDSAGITGISLLDCECTVRVPANHRLRMCVGCGSRVIVECGSDSVVLCDLWSDSSCDIADGSSGKVKFKHHGEGRQGR